MSEKEKIFGHIPVFCDEILEIIPENGPIRVIDGTLGYGGHSSLILEKNRQAELLGIDRDGEALAGAEEKLKFALGRVYFERGNFSDLKKHASEVGWTSADVVLLDVGVSSPQIDNPQRGFSFRRDGPLDMRMDKRSPSTASRILNNASYDELERIFREYGEVPRSRNLAKAVIERREEKPWARTLEFAELCEDVSGRGRPGAPPAPTLCFQALRIAVNGELDELKKALTDAIGMLNPGGKIAVISFHSLEDRIVKNFFRDAASDCLCPPGLPACVCGHKAVLKILTKKPLSPSAEEKRKNPRASSAKLRIAEKKG